MIFGDLPDSENVRDQVDIPLPWEWNSGERLWDRAGCVLAQSLTALRGHTGRVQARRTPLVQVKRLREYGSRARSPTKIEWVWLIIKICTFRDGRDGPTAHADILDRV